MVIVTTLIYQCVELKRTEKVAKENLVEESVPGLSDEGWELLSIYQGQNRMIPID